MTNTALDRLTAAAPALPAMPNLPAMPDLSNLPAIPNLPAMPDLSNLPAMPDLSDLSALGRSGLPPVPAWVPITPLQAKVTLMSIRSVIGVLGWLFPNLAGRMFGIDPEKNPAAPYLGRLFAARELALVAPLLTEDETVQRRSLQVGIAVDSADAVAAAVAGVRGTLPKRAAAMTFLTAVAAALLGWIAASGD